MSCYRHTTQLKFYMFRLILLMLFSVSPCKPRYPRPYCHSQPKKVLAQGRGLALDWGVSFGKACLSLLGSICLDIITWNIQIITGRVTPWGGPCSPPGVLGFWKNSQKIIQTFTCIKIPQIITLMPILSYLNCLGGPLRVNKVILLSSDFFLVESMCSFRQNT